MEGVGARLGRSSSRYGTTTVFSGPVRKWKKDWVSIPPSSSSSSSNNNHHLPSSSSSLGNGGAINGSTNGSVSHLRLFKWTPLSQKDDSIANNNNGETNNNTPNNDTPSIEDAVSEEPPRRKFKYIPVAALVEQRKGTEENTDAEGRPADVDENTTELASKSDGHDEKPDINDMPMEEDQESEEGNQTVPERQDLNKSLDLSLG